MSCEAQVLNLYFIFTSAAAILPDNGFPQTLSSGKQQAEAASRAPGTKLPCPSWALRALRHHQPCCPHPAVALARAWTALVAQASVYQFLNPRSQHGAQQLSPRDVPCQGQGATLWAGTWGRSGCRLHGHSQGLKGWLHHSAVRGPHLGHKAHSLCLTSPFYDMGTTGARCLQALWKGVGFEPLGSASCVRPRPEATPTAWRGEGRTVVFCTLSHLCSPCDPLGCRGGELGQPSSSR